MAQASKHSAIFIGAYLLTAALNYAFGVAMSWYLPPGAYGILGVAQSLLMLLALAAGSGFAWTAARDLAAQGVTGYTRQRFRAALTANLAVGILLAGLLWLAYQSGLLPLGSAYRGIIPLIGLVTVLLATRGVLNGAGRGLYYFTPVALNLTLEVGVKSVAGIALVLSGAGVAGVLWAFVLGAGVSLLHSFWVIRPARLWQGRGWFEAHIWADTAPLFAGMMGTALMLNLDVLLLKLLAPLAQGDLLAGEYQAAVILARTPVYMAQALTLVLFSYAAGTRGDQAAHTLAATRSALTAWLRMLVPGALVLMIAPNAILSVFFPAHYQSAGPALQVSALGCALLALTTLLNGILQGSGERRITAISAVTATLAQVLALFWLIPRLGILGAALSLVVAGVVSLAMLAPAFTGQRGAILAGWRSLRPGFIKMLLPYAALILGLVWLPGSGRLEILTGLTLTGGVYLLALIVTSGDGPVGDTPAGTAGLRRPASAILRRLVQDLLGG